MDAHEVQVLLQRLAFAEAKRDALERQLQESYDLVRTCVTCMVCPNDVRAERPTQGGL